MFGFKQFTIYQDQTAMKVGTDGVLIGAWAAVDQADECILDIGTGTGLIALMLAQRTPSAQVVDAVEIDEQAALQAADNFTNSKWSQIINIHNVDITNFNKEFKYDSIVSNPPFFCDSLLSPDPGRTAARHTIALTFDDLICSVVHLLKPNGRFSVILPTNESERFEKAAAGRIYLWRRCNVRSRSNSDIKRVMSEYRLSAAVNTTEEELSIRLPNSNEYSDEYRNLTAEFYLKF